MNPNIILIGINLVTSILVLPCAALGAYAAIKLHERNTRKKS